MANARPGFFEWFTRIFITGVLALLPLALTLYVLGWVVGILHDLAGPGSSIGRLLTSAGLSLVACEITAYVLGFLGAAALVFGLGLLGEWGLFRSWRELLDRLLRRVPMFGTLYEAAKQLTSLFHRKPDAMQSMIPVMCYFGGDRSVGTPALMPTPELVRMGEVDYHLVILPTAPVPFGGALLCVKADWIEPAGCSLEELVSIYVSMGVTAPSSLGHGRGDGQAQSPDDATGSGDVGKKTQ